MPFAAQRRARLLRSASGTRNGRPRRCQLSLEILESRHLLSNDLAYIGLTFGWATFGQALPQGAAYDGVTVGGLATQNDVKSRWDDGSIRFVVLTTFVPTDGTYALAPGAPATGTCTPAVPDASVRLTIGGVPYTATLPTDILSSDLWLSGPDVV